jgi:hypothetical protein
VVSLKLQKKKFCRIVFNRVPCNNKLNYIFTKIFIIKIIKITLFKIFRLLNSKREECLKSLEALQKVYQLFSLGYNSGVVVNT